MKLLIVGATGMIGARLTAEAVARGHAVTAAVRDPVRVPAGIPAVALRADDAAALAAAAAGQDVILAAVSPRSTGDAVAEARGYAAALVAAAVASGARLVVVGGAGSTLLPDGRRTLEVVPEIYRAEATAGLAAYQDISRSEADWTVVPPPSMIAPGERTGHYRTGGEHLVTAADGSSSISAEDFAIAVLDEIETPRHRRAMMSVGT
jgi:hypothetical protein